jgi:hypothetical protein
MVAAAHRPATSSPLDVYGVNAASGLPQAKVITRPNRPVVGAPRYADRLWHRGVRP